MLKGIDQKNGGADSTTTRHFWREAYPHHLIQSKTNPLTALRHAGTTGDVCRLYVCHRACHLQRLDDLSTPCEVLADVLDLYEELAPLE